MGLYPHENVSPQVAADAFIAPGAHLTGRVTVHSRASIWFNAVLRGDVEPITIGSRSNVQDLSVLHTDLGFPLVIGEDVTIGHGAILHGCVIADGALIGMGAIVLNGARIGEGAVIAAGALVPEGAEVPAGRLAMGIPARVVRVVSEEERRRQLAGVESYVRRAESYRRGGL